MVDISSSPYHDDYDKSKGYNQILAVPGRVAQAREFTQIQTILRDHLGRLGDAILSDGSIIEGCSIFIDTDALNVRITSGKIYLDGCVRIVNEDTLTISGEGEEAIGVKLVTSIITDQEDESLRDPAQSYANYSNPGANRLKEEIVLTLNDPNATTIYTLQDGQLITVVQSTPLDWLLDILAQRTFDQSGNYAVNGFRSFESDKKTEENLFVEIDSGLAYIKGYEINKSSFKVPVRKSTDKRTITQEMQTYSEGINEYIIFNHPVSEITNLTAQIKVENEARTRGSVAGGQDILSQTPVHQILTVSSQPGGTGTLYVQGSGGDYVRNGNYVDWSPSGNEPAIGSTYYVTYIYNKALVQDVDYELSYWKIVSDENLVSGNSAIQQGGTDYFPVKPGSVIITIPAGVITDDGEGNLIAGEGVSFHVDSASTINYETGAYDFTLESAPGATPTMDYEYNTDKSYVRFLESGDLPVNDSNFQYNYNFYMARRDLITLSQSGEYLVIEGNPEVPRYLNFHKNPNPDTIDICYVTVSNKSALSEDPAFKNESMLDIIGLVIFRSTMEQLNKLKGRVTRSEYNTAVQDLDKEALSGEDLTTLKGILTDGFYNFEKADINHPDFDASFDMAYQELTLATSAEAFPLVYAEDDLENNSVRWGSKIVLPYSEELSIFQPNATEEIKINPYAVFFSHGLLNIDPAFDSWTIDDVVYRTVEGNNTVSTQTIRAHGTNRDNVTSTTRYVETNELMNELIEYARQIEISIQGEDFTPWADNLLLSFDGEVIPGEVDDAQYEGTESGTFKCNIEGYFEGKFTVPEGTRTGERRVRVSNEFNEASTYFESEGRYILNEIVQAVDTHTTRVRYAPPPPARVSFGGFGFSSARTTDPVAQSFAFPSYRTITAVGLYFANKTDEKVHVLLRTMENGYPGRMDLRGSEVVLSPEDILVSNDASLETKVNFPEPFWIGDWEQICINLITGCQETSVWVATMGQPLIGEEAAQIAQPYMEGVFFTSSNNITWNAHQMTDMKFKIYTANFEETGTVIYEAIDGVNLNEVITTIREQLPRRTEAPVFYQVNNNGHWIPLDRYMLREFDEEVTNIKVKIEVTADPTSRLTPLIEDNHSSQIIGFVRNSPCNYITRNVNLPAEETYDTVRQVLDVHKPSDTDVSVYYSIDDGENWVGSTEVSTQQLDQMWTRYFFENAVGSNATQFRAKIVLSTSNLIRRPICKNFINKWSDEV